MISIQAEPLTKLAQSIFEASGVVKADAHLVADSLVKTNLAGHDSHGVIRVSQYLQGIEDGIINAKASPTIERETATITTINGHFGLGHVIADYGIRATIKKAKSHDIAATGLTNCGHVGRLGEWVALAAEENMVGLAFCNGGSPGGLVAPYGSAQRFMGTNPFAAAVPVKDSPAIVLDFATSVMAEGKVRVARNKGATLPEGVVQTQAGLATTNPNDLYGGGALIPMGGHKGSGLSFLMELLGGLLLAQGSPSLPNYGNFHNGVLFIVLSIEAFRPLEPFLRDSQELSALFKAVATAPNVDAVLLPGEPERIMTQQRLESGIPIDETTWAQLSDCASKFNLEIPTVMRVEE